MTDEDYTPQEFVDYLQNTLIPDLRESGNDETAGDFITAVQIIEGLMPNEVLADPVEVASFLTEAFRNEVNKPVSRDRLFAAQGLCYFFLAREMSQMVQLIIHGPEGSEG